MISILKYLSLELRKLTSLTRTSDTVFVLYYSQVRLYLPNNTQLYLLCFPKTSHIALQSHCITFVTKIHRNLNNYQKHPDKSILVRTKKPIEHFKSTFTQNNTTHFGVNERLFVILFIIMQNKSDALTFKKTHICKKVICCIIS